jgi:hypothetical protein
MRPGARGGAGGAPASPHALPIAAAPPPGEIFENQWLSRSGAWQDRCDRAALGGPGGRPESDLRPAWSDASGWLQLHREGFEPPTGCVWASAWEVDWGGVWAGSGGVGGEGWA